MIKNFCEEIFYEADIFKVPFILLFQNRKQSSTILGSLFSFTIVAIVLYLFTTSNMLLKINPLVIDQTTTNDHAALIDLSASNFEIAAGVANSFGLGFQDPTIFKVQFIQIEIDFNETINSKQISKKVIKPTKPCTPDSFKDPTTFNSLGLANYACPKDGTFQLEGGFDERSVKAVVVMISYCNNQTDGVICKSQADINTFFKDKGLWLYYQDDIYDISNYQNPLKKNWRLQAIQCAAVSRIIDLYLKKLIFINDDSFLFTNDQSLYGFMKERSEGLSDYVMVDSPLISINLFSSKNNQKTKRQYQKLGDLIASIGGIINVLIIIGFIITNLENQLQMQNHIMNSLYSYSYEKREKLPKMKSSRKKMLESSKDTKGDPHLYDWNKDYEEMISKDPLSPELLNKEQPDQYKVKDLNEHTQINMKEIQNTTSPPVSKVFEMVSPGITNSNILVSLVKEEKDLKIDTNTRSLSKTEPSKSRFATKFEVPKLIYEQNNKNLSRALTPSSPEHNRGMSPGLRPKELYLPSGESVKKEFTKSFKDDDDTKPVSLRISEFMMMKLKVMFKKRLNTKEKLFLLSEKRFRKETDIVNILEKIQEFDKFKMLMLTPDQMALFNLLAKPLIYLESQRDQFRKRSSYMIARSLDVDAAMRNDAKRRIAELKTHYRKMLNEPNLSYIDKNLLQMIEDDIFIKND